VDSVEVLQQTSDGTFGGMCPDGFVYNLEVEDTHTYIANNCVVHNCHECAASTVYKVTVATEKAVYRVGLSGTPLDRSDRKGMLTIGALGPVIHRVKTDELIKAGFLSKPTIEMYQLEQESVKPTVQGAYGELIVRSTSRNRLVASLMKKATKPNLTFVKEIKHGRALIERAQKAGLRVEFVWGDKKTPERDAAVTRLVRGDIDCIVCSVVYQQGIDIESLRSIVIASAGKSVIATLQRIGRGMRVTKDKNTFEVYDIHDRGNKWMSRHANERRKAYERENHEVTIIKYE
jgi:superfamily II DNA or RNA helicase